MARQFWTDDDAMGFAALGVDAKQAFEALGLAAHTAGLTFNEFARSLRALTGELPVEPKPLPVEPKQPTRYRRRITLEEEP